MTDNKKAILCAAFPGTGKSTFFKSHIHTTLDSDSSNFSWVVKGICCSSNPGISHHNDCDKCEGFKTEKVRNPDFPQNYIEHIKEHLNLANVICISSHEEVRNALVENEMSFTLVYPEKKLKREYLKRFKERGNSEDFIKLLDKNWNEWIEQLQKQEGCKHIVLKSGEFISDIKF